MPELPEVETIRRDLSEKVLDKRIVEANVSLPKIVRNPEDFFQKNLVGKRFEKIDRRGKLIIFEISNGLFMLVHLKMTGQLIYKYKNNVVAGGHSEKAMGFDLPNKYSHVIFEFEDGGKLFFNDLRQFGYLKIVDTKELEVIKSKFGFEPLKDNFDLPVFRGLLKGRKRNVKAFLLDQSMVTGLGNIYADEVLFASKVSPLRNTADLTAKEIENIFKNIKAILEKAILHRGTTFNNYVDAEGKKGNFVKMLKVYGRGGGKCTYCGNKLEKIKVAGRGTVFCPKCQK